MSTAPQTVTSTEDSPELFEKVVHINRCAKVVKGGRRFSFSALVVTGDQQGTIGYGYGKAKEVPQAIQKGTDQANRNKLSVQIKGDTIPHEVLGIADGGKVMLKPAAPGTGIIAGSAVRAVVEAAGIKNILTKSLGSNNKLALVHATIAGLKKLRTSESVEVLRGKVEAPVEVVEEEAVAEEEETPVAAPQIPAPVAEEPKKES